MSEIPMLKRNGRSHIHDPLSMDIWDTLKDLQKHHEAMVAHHAPLLHGNTVAPLVEWKETPEAHTLSVELPGFNKEEVKVEVKEGNCLKISGKKKVDKEENHDNWHHVHRSKAQFSRVFTLPENSRADRVNSHFENALLTVTVPKLDVKKSHVARNIQVMGRDIV